MVPDEGTRCWEVQGLAPAINNRINRLTTAVPHCGHILTATAAGGAAISTALAASARDAQKCYTLCNPVTQCETHVSNRRRRGAYGAVAGPSPNFYNSALPCLGLSAARAVTLALVMLGRHPVLSLAGLGWSRWGVWGCQEWLACKLWMRLQNPEHVSELVSCRLPAL